MFNILRVLSQTHDLSWILYNNKEYSLFSELNNLHGPHILLYSTLIGVPCRFSILVSVGERGCDVEILTSIRNKQGSVYVFVILMYSRSLSRVLTSRDEVHDIEYACQNKENTHLYGGSTNVIESSSTPLPLAVSGVGNRRHGLLSKD